MKIAVIALAFLVTPPLWELATSSACRFLLAKTARYGEGSDPLRLWLLSIVIFYDKLCMNVEELVLAALGRSERIERPLFVLGHMRSGTTNLHRSLIRSRAETTFLSLLDVLVSSYTLRYPLLLAFHLYMLRIGAYERADHRVGMDEAEEEDMALIHRYKGLLLLEVFSVRFLTHPEVYNDLHEPYDRADVAYLKRLMCRRIRSSTCPQWIGKPITFVTRLDLLRAAFPDALFVLSIRNPCDAIASTLHMHRHKLHVENEMKRSLLLYRAVCDLLLQRDERVLPVRFEDYIQNRAHWIAKILERLDGYDEDAAPEQTRLEPREDHEKDALYLSTARRQVFEKSDSWQPIFEQLGYKLPCPD
jgi:hypothetical protein